MSLSTTRSRPRRATVANEEERAWVGFYHRVGRDPSIAAEVMAQLEADVEMKRAHLALYLSCRESLRRHEQREQRNLRIGQFVRRALAGLFVDFPRALGRRLQRAGDIAVACLPEASVDPAQRQVRRLADDPEFEGARASFTPPAAMPASASNR